MLFTKYPSVYVFTFFIPSPSIYETASMHVDVMFVRIYVASVLLNMNAIAVLIHVTACIFAENL